MKVIETFWVVATRFEGEGMDWECGVTWSDGFGYEVDEGIEVLEGLIVEVEVEELKVEEFVSLWEDGCCCSKFGWYEGEDVKENWIC